MAANQNKREKPKKRIFYPVYWLLVMIAAVLIALLMQDIWMIMEDYEASMPKYVAQDAEKIFTSRDFATIYQYDDLSLCQQESKEAYIQYMQRLTAGYEITCQEKFSANADEKVYQVKYGDHKFAVYTLGKSGEKSKHGNDLWMLKSITTSVIAPQEYQIMVPETSTVYADGVRLGSEDIVERDLDLNEEYLPEGYEPTLWQVYSVERCFAMPKFEVSDGDGRAQKIIPGEQGRMTVTVNYDDDKIRSKVEERIFYIAETFAMFTSDDVAGRQARKCTVEGSKALEYIRSFDGGWFTNHRDVEFENMRSERYVQYDDGSFSCDIYFDYIVEYRNGTKQTYPTAYTFFLNEVSEECLLFDFAMIEYES